MESKFKAFNKEWNEDLVEKYSGVDIYKINQAIPKNILYYFSTGNEENELYVVRFKDKILGYIVKVVSKYPKADVSYKKFVTGNFSEYKSDSVLEEIIKYVGGSNRL